MTTPPPPPPPSGWYPDSSGGSRYWDGSAWGPLTAPEGSLPPPPPPRTDLPAPPLTTPAVKNKSNRMVLAAGAAVLLMAGAGVAAINTNDSDSSSSSGSTTPWPTVTPEEIQAQRAAQRARLDPSTYEQITPREFALIAKDPDAHRMRKLVLYGVVTQFDSATGTEGFRANVDAVPHPKSYKFDQNTILAASDPAILADVVEKDFVTMWVSAAESYTYDTQLGGSTTVPKFTVDIIKVTGSSS